MEFSRFYNDTVNELLARGEYPYRAEREAEELALAASQAGKVTPKPTDWDLP